MFSIDRSLIPAPILELCRLLRAHAFEAYLVGGSVRDLLLHRPIQDWDVATSALPEQVQQIFSKTVPTGIKHGTITVFLEHGHFKVEVTTYRGESAYSDARHPDSIIFLRNIDEDLARRDFTINALAYDPLNNQLLDPFNGAADLTNRLIRAVGDPALRFAEDGLRLLRAVRLAAMLEFDIEEKTLSAIPLAIGSFRHISMERVRDELLKLLSAPRPSRGLELMRHTGLLAEILPELLDSIGLKQNRFHSDDVYTHSLRTCDEMRGDSILRLTALLHDVGKPLVAKPHPTRSDENTFYNHETESMRLCQVIGQRLKLSNEQRQRLAHLVRYHFFQVDGWKKPAIRRFLAQVGVENVKDLFSLREADLRARNLPDTSKRLEQLVAFRCEIDQILAEKTALRTQDLAINGNTIMAHLGIAPGPRVRQILHALLERVLDDPSLNEPESLLRLVDEIARITQ